MGLLNEGGPAFKFEKVGDTFEGVVVSESELEDRDPNGNPKTWSNGEPKKVYVLNCEEKDSGEVMSIWARGNMVKAIRTAAREAKARELLGHEIKIRFDGLGESKTPGFAPAKLFRAKVSQEAVKTVAVSSGVLGGSAQDDEEPF